MGITFAYFVLHFDEFRRALATHPICAHGFFRLTTAIEAPFAHDPVSTTLMCLCLIYHEIDFTP